MNVEVDELVPRDGKDERYDEVIAEIGSLEKSLEADLKKFEKSLGSVMVASSAMTVIIDTIKRIKLAYWHSNIGNKV